MPEICANSRCAKPFDRAHRDQKYCSRACKENARKLRVGSTWGPRYTKVDHPPKPCAICGAEFKPARVVNETCSPSCAAIRAEQLRRARKRVRNCDSTARRNARIWKKECGIKCQRCGFKALHSCQLDAHHKDFNRTNNTPENLQVLCANCHRLVHQIHHELALV